MGATDSKQKLGERVLAARNKLEKDKELQDERIEFLKTKSPLTLNVMMTNICDSFKTYSPFLEHTLLITWQSDPAQCQQIIIKSCKKVLTAPIIADEYDWFKQYVLPSSIWFYKINKDKYMFEELLNIVKNMSTEIIHTMDSIYSLFQSHPKWKELINIKNESIIKRQDDNKVGLLKEKGITDIMDVKHEAGDGDAYGAEEMQTFIDSNLAVNILTTTAKQINGQFQDHMNRVMSRFGSFKPGPLKKVDRCQSKLENDYQNEKFPKAAKLLDIIRSSTTFNTLEQLIGGYEGLMNHIKLNPTMIELARVKNGFLDVNYSGGYRDIKINVVYHSSINPGVSMVCEIQLILLNYLHEKKRIHKLYSIARQELYFQMVVKSTQQTDEKKEMSDLKFVPVLKIGKNKHVETNDGYYDMDKCSVDTDLKLLAMENRKWFGCVDMNSKKVIFEQKRDFNQARHSHRWLSLNNDKYFAIQTSLNIIKLFKVKLNKQFEENEALRICFSENDVINFVEFDRDFENVFIVINSKIFEQRSMRNVNKVLIRIELEQELYKSGLKQLILSDDGTLCVIGGGRDKNYFYLIDIQKKKQYKLVSNVLSSTYCPRFIDGNIQYIAVANRKKIIEIWSILKQKPIKIIDIGKDEYISSMTAANGMLAVGTDNSANAYIRLYDTTNWEMFWSEKYDVLYPYSLHLTQDSKYLTIGGNWNKGRQSKCVVLQIQY